MEAVEKELKKEREKKVCIWGISDQNGNFCLPFSFMFCITNNFQRLISYHLTKSKQKGRYGSERSECSLDPNSVTPSARQTFPWS